MRKPTSKPNTQPVCQAWIDYIKYADMHPEWINKDRRMLIQNIMEPILNGSVQNTTFDAEMYSKCVRFVEANYYRLFPYQKAIISAMFWYKDNKPMFPKIFVLMGRGNGKDGFVVPVANFVMTPLYGEHHYNVEIVANAEDQAHDTFNVCYDMLHGNPKFKGKFKVNKSEITNLATGSFMRFNSSNAGTKDGKKIGLLIFNEYHAYEDYSQINVFTSAQGKADAKSMTNPQKTTYPREFIITTNGYVREAPLDDELSIAQKILETRDIEAKTFPFICKMDSPKEVSTDLKNVDAVIERIHKANPSLEYMPVLKDTIVKDLRESIENPARMPEFLTKRCNLPAEKAAGEQVTSWDNILLCSYTDPDHKKERMLPTEEGNDAVIGIDYADIRDFASAGILTKTPKGEYAWRQQSWIDANSPFFKSIKFPFDQIGNDGFQDFGITYEPTIPIPEICDYVQDLMQTYNVHKIALDMYRWTIFKQEFINRGISIESKQNPYGIVRLIRRIGSVAAITAPAVQQEFENHNIIYGNSSIMRWYTNNTELIQNKTGNIYFGKIEPKLRKNDGFMALMAAMYCKDELEESVIYV